MKKIEVEVRWAEGPSTPAWVRLMELLVKKTEEPGLKEVSCLDLPEEDEPRLCK